MQNYVEINSIRIEQDKIKLKNRLEESCGFTLQIGFSLHT
jgi:hypothetical protein